MQRKSVREGVGTGEGKKRQKLGAFVIILSMFDNVHHHFILFFLEL